MDSFIKWYGGKSGLRNKIISLMPKHRTYIELFGGAGWVLFGKPKSQIEIINDVDQGLINLYQTVKNHTEEFIKELSQYPISEDLFNVISERYTSAGPGGYTFAGSKSLKKACETYYLIMNSFNGNIAQPNFAYPNDRNSGFIKFYKTDWYQIRNRLKSVCILNKDFTEILKRYNKPENLFYIDSPYTMATENYYKFTFTKEQHEILKVYLHELRAQFILSYNNCKQIRDSYKNFNIIEINDKELLITNFTPPETPYFLCREGIPIHPETSWKNGNCPFCNSRDIQQVTKRITLKGKKRNWLQCGFVCNSCNNLFNPELQKVYLTDQEGNGIPSSSSTIKEGPQ